MNVCVLHMYVVLHRMESFPGVASRVLQEFKTLLQHGPSLLGSTHMLQIITINMFTIHNAHGRGNSTHTHHHSSKNKYRVQA